jgi:hypothetical protein
MALLVMDGFEFAPLVRSAYTVSGGSILVATGRDGVGKALQTQTGSVVIPVSAATVIIGIGVAIPSGAYGSGPSSFFQIWGDAGATQHLTFQIDANGHVTVKRGSVSGTLLGTGTNAISSNAWHWFEIKATIADAGGIVVVKVDGITEINFTGDTKNAGTLTTVSTVVIPGGGSPSAFDDLVICDATGSAPFNDFFGEKVIRMKRPNGNGATNQWIGSDADSVNNYLLVDDPPPVSSTDYTGSPTATERDLYALSSATGLASVDAIQNIAYVAKSDAGVRSVKTVTRNAGGTVTASPAVPLSTTYVLAQGGIEQTDPSGAAWTPTNINTIQAGVECV